MKNKRKKLKKSDKEKQRKQSRHVFKRKKTCVQKKENR